MCLSIYQDLVITEPLNQQRTQPITSPNAQLNFTKHFKATRLDIKN